MSEKGTGLELIQREVLLVLFRNLNEEIGNVQQEWYDRDLEFISETGIGSDRTTIECVENENFFPGHKPSLLDRATRESFPNISVICYEARPEEEDNIDQIADWRITIDIECFVKSEDSEIECDRRCHRTKEAVIRVMDGKENLNGLTTGWKSDPLVNLTDIFIRPEENTHGQDWYWQGFRIRYNTLHHSDINYF